MITRRKPINRVSKKRKSALVEYRRRRFKFLEAHPYCQVWLAEHGFNESCVGLDGIVQLETGLGVARLFAPRSTEIHHTKKPKATYLNDESTWLAVCREMHDKIESNKAWARQKGYLQNI